MSMANMSNDHSLTLDEVGTVSVIPSKRCNTIAVTMSEDWSLNGYYHNAKVVKSESEVGGLDETTLSLEEMLNRMQRNFCQQLEDKNKKIDDLKNELMDAQNERKLILEEFGRYIFESDEKDTKKKREELFEKTFKVNVVNVTSPTTEAAQELPQADEASISASSAASMETIGTEANVEIIVVQEIPRNDEVKISVQESREDTKNRGRISLTTMPSTAVERSIYNHYKILMLTISDMLLSDDVRVFKIWARDTFSLNPQSDVNEVFLKLDRKGVISSTNLTQLREFFAEKLLRIDVAHLIDCFLLGDYTHLLRSINSGKNNEPSSITRSGAQVVTHAVAEPRQSSRYGLLLGGARNYGVGNCEIENYPNTNPSSAGLVVPDGGAHHQCDTRHGKVGIVPSKSDGDQHLRSRPSATEQREAQVDMGSNGNKLSKPLHQDSSKNPNPASPQDSNDDDFDDEDGNWLCNHYKRHCYVKFACCDKYWPCHRCHNNESNCEQKKLKSIHTKFVKCVKCSTEQEFNERSQYCVNCYTKFAKYFCPTCKHLTGKDDNPYHCEQCGICRIHEHRSFHCDTCGVCLDVQLRDNHKCREGSAHDECCICLEDAFTGCQILPCSHKVHKECATRMIRSGITRCPICRESFAHKLEKRPAVKPLAQKHNERK